MKTKSLTQLFMDEMVKEAADKAHKININIGDKKKDDKPKEQAAAPAQDPMAGGQPQQDPMAAQMGGQPGMDPSMGGMGMPAPMPMTDTNNMRQSGLPTTAIVCNSDCINAQNEKGMCCLNKINFTQVRDGIMACENYEPSISEPLVQPQGV